MPLSALVGVWGEAGEGCGLSAGHRAEFGHQGGDGDGGDVAATGNVFDDGGSPHI